MANYDIWTDAVHTRAGNAIHHYFSSTFSLAISMSSVHICTSSSIFMVILRSGNAEILVNVNSECQAGDAR